MPGGLAVATESFQFRRHSSPVNVIVVIVRQRPVGRRPDVDEGRVAAGAMDRLPREGVVEAPSFGVNRQLDADPLATIDLVVNDHRRRVGHHSIDWHRDVLVERRYSVLHDVFQRLCSSVTNTLMYAADMNRLSRFCVNTVTNTTVMCLYRLS